MGNYFCVFDRFHGTRSIALSLIVGTCLFSVSSLHAQDSAKSYVEKVDPLEGINRDIHSFNEFADTYVTRPLAKGYRDLMPDSVEHSVIRAFDNLQEVGSAVNNLAQGKGHSSAKNAGRFLVNSTIGILGIFDVAEKIGIEKESPEDFGQTLATWGVGSGPYIVLPFMGPSTLRDAPSRFVDLYLRPPIYIDDIIVRNAVLGVEVVSERSELLDFEEAIPEDDAYSFIRDAYLQQREHQIKDGQVVDDFGSDASGDFLD